MTYTETSPPKPPRGKRSISETPKKHAAESKQHPKKSHQHVPEKSKSSKEVHPPATPKKEAAVRKNSSSKDPKNTKKDAHDVIADVKVAKEMKENIKNIIGHDPHPLTREEGKVAEAMFLESPDLKKAAAAEKKELKNVILHPPPSSHARTKKTKSIEEEAHAAQWEMHASLHAIHANMKKPDGMSQWAWYAKNFGTSAGLILSAEDRFHKAFLSPLCRAILEDTAVETGIRDSSFDTMFDDGILSVGDKNVPWPQNRCLFLNMQESNCSSVFHKHLHENARRSSSKRATLSDFMRIVSLNPRAIHEESMALGERLHFCYDVLDVWGELLGPGRLHLGSDGLMGALKSEKAVLDALPGLRTIRNPAHYRDSYCGASTLPASFDESKEPQHVSSFEAETLLRGIAAFLYCDILDRLKRRREHGHHGMMHCETPKGDVDYHEMGQELLETLASTESDDHTDQAIQKRLTYLFGHAACSKLKSWDAHIDGLLEDLESVRRRLVPWAARYHIRDGITHGFWGAAGWVKDQAERVGSLLRHRVVRKVVRHTVRSITWAVDQLQMARWFHYISKKAICIFYLLYTCFKGDNFSESYKNLATFIFSKQVTDLFSSCVGMWNTVTSFDWTSMSSYITQPLTLLGQLGWAFRNLWNLVADSLRSILPVSGELMAVKLNVSAAEYIASLAGMIPFIGHFASEAARKLEEVQGYLTFAIGWILPFETLWKFSRANEYALSYVTHSTRGGIMWNLGVALLMYSATGDGLSLALRFLHALCHYYGYDDCERKQKNYRTIAKLYYSMKAIWTLATGLLLVFTGGVSGGAAAISVLLFKELASDIWMIVGNKGGFIKVHCLESNEETNDIKNKYDVQKLVEDKLKNYDATSFNTYRRYVPQPFKATSPQSPHAPSTPSIPFSEQMKESAENAQKENERAAQDLNNMFKTQTKER